MRRTCLLLLLGLVSAGGQVREVDRAKLPQDAAVQAAYTDLLTIDGYARNYETKWRFPVPKQQVVLRFTHDLQVLEVARKTAPENGELRLLTGLVGHLTYNLDVESAYVPARDLLTAALADAGEDERPAWFLGMHRCESNDPVGGMGLLLGDESSHAVLPGAFWQDYMLCARVTSMPAHLLRAYERLGKMGAVSADDKALAEATDERYKAGSALRTYTNREAWQVEESAGKVRFTSTLCGELFVVPEAWRMDVGAVTQGSCTVQMIPGSYATRDGTSSPTVLILTQVAKPGATLEGWMGHFVEDAKYAGAQRVEGMKCPVAACVGYEIETQAMYAKQGGAHLLALGFAGQEPGYPGVLLEVPHALPDSAAKGPQFYRPGDTLRRFSGTLFTVVLLDANQDIYQRAREDFDAVLGSMVVDAR